MVKLVDTHAHIFVEEFDDLETVISESLETGVEMVLMPNIDIESIDDVIKTNQLYPENTKMMMGLHPSSVNSKYQENLAFIKAKLDALNCCAVGEIGLDFYWSEEFKSEQIEALEIQLQWAVNSDLPVSLHTRNATDETIAICKNFKGLRGVFHCFGGSLKQANEIIDLEMYLGIGGVLTFKNSGLAEVLKDVDISHLVLETDAPYLAPHPNRGKRNEPAYLAIIAHKLADVKDVSFEDAAKQTTLNAEKIFKLSI